MKIHKGDTVIITNGKDRNKTGKVLEVLPKKDIVIIEGLNLYKKHQKARSSGQKGGIIEKPMPVHISNVMMLDPKTKKGVRVGYSLQQSQKVRVMKGRGKGAVISK